MTAVAEARDLTRHYSIRRGVFAPPATLKAVDGVSFTVEPGRTLAVVGESGCGKSTLARLVTLIEPPTAGQLSLIGRDAVKPSPADRTPLRRAVQIVFQNPYGSLNPRKRIGTILEEPLVINTDLPKAERRDLALDMMRKVGLRRSPADTTIDLAIDNQAATDARADGDVENRRQMFPCTKQGLGQTGHVGIVAQCYRPAE